MIKTFMDSILTAFRSQAKPYLIGAGVLVASLGLILPFACRVKGKSAPVAPPPVAVKHHDEAVEAKGEQKALHQVRVAADPALQASRQETAQAKADLAKVLEALRQAGLTPAPATPDDLKGKALEACIETTQAQDRKAALLEGQLATATAEADASTRAASSFEQEALVLRKGLKPVYTRALGALWNPSDKTWGLSGSQDLGRIRIGAEVFQQRLPVLAGGNVKWASQVRVEWRF